MRLIVFIFLVCFVATASAESINSEILEAIHEAPEAIEQIVMSPEKGMMASPWFLGSLIFALTFIIEEIAVAGGAYFVVSGRLSPSIAFLSLYIGIFVSDLCLYGLGVLLRRSRWIRSYVDLSHYETKTKDSLSRGIWMAITVARIVPGMLIPIFIVLGFTRTDLRKVSFINLFVTAAYSAVVLYLLLYLGTRVSDLVGIGVGLSLFALFLVYIYRDKLWVFLGARYHLLFAPKAVPWPKETHLGMPSLKAPRHLTLFEQLPYGVVYTPVYFAYFVNALRFFTISAPGAANPGIENSGICGESKSKILSMIAGNFPEFVPPFVAFPVTSALSTEDIVEQMRSAGFDFPVIAKPDIGYMSRGVELISDESALESYLARFPQNQIVILQEYLASDGEAGVYYACHPSVQGTPTIEVALTYFPFVVGDGATSLIGLVNRDPRYSYFRHTFCFADGERIPATGEVVRLKISGSTQDGSLHQKIATDGHDSLIRIITEISQSIPEFWLGRYDIKFTSVEALLRGDFKILELNGAAGENLTAWDPSGSIVGSYRTLFVQLRSLFEFGRENQRRGFRSISGAKLIRTYIEQESLLFRLARTTHGRERAEHSEHRRPLI